MPTVIEVEAAARAAGRRLGRRRVQQLLRRGLYRASPGTEVWTTGRVRRYRVSPEVARALVAYGGRPPAEFGPPAGEREMRATRLAWTVLLILSTDPTRYWPVRELLVGQERKAARRRLRALVDLGLVESRTIIPLRSGHQRLAGGFRITEEGARCLLSRRSEGIMS